VYIWLGWDVIAIHRGTEDCREEYIYIYFFSPCLKTNVFNLVLQLAALPDICVMTAGGNVHGRKPEFEDAKLDLTPVLLKIHYAYYC